MYRAVAITRSIHNLAISCSRQPVLECVPLPPCLWFTLTVLPAPDEILSGTRGLTSADCRAVSRFIEADTSSLVLSVRLGLVRGGFQSGKV